MLQDNLLSRVLMLVFPLKLGFKLLYLMTCSKPSASLEFNVHKNYLGIELNYRISSFLTRLDVLHF